MANYSSFTAADFKNPSFDHLPQICQLPLIMPAPGARQEAMLMQNAAVGEEGTTSQEPGKLFSHWNDVAGRVCIPEKWGQEALLKDWMDCSPFDALLAPKEVASAREALVAQRKRPETTRQLIKMKRMY